MTGVSTKALATAAARPYRSPRAMNARAAVRLATGLWAFLIAVTVAATILLIVTREAPVPASFGFRGYDITLTVVVGSVGALMAARRPENVIGWLLLAAGVASGIQYFAAQYAILSTWRYERSLPLTVPFAWAQNWAWVWLTGTVGIVVPQLFPDGKPLSRAWGRFVKYVVPMVLIVFAAGIAFAPGRLDSMVAGFENPYTASPSVSELLEAIGGLGFGLCLVATVVAVVKRFRRSTGVAREQMKWLALAATGLGLTLGVAGVPVFLIIGTEATGGGGSAAVKAVEMSIVISILGIPISTGIAILRHRLYDIDVVINKAVLFGALVAGISALYVAVVVGVGAAVGTRGESNVGLSVAATAVVALAFQPLRAWARRVANRFVYGKRATPHEVLSVLGDRIAEAYSLDDVLPRLAQLVTEATAASRAEVWVRVAGELRPAAAWPADTIDRLPVPLRDSETPFIPGAEHVFPVRHQAELLGAIAVAAPANEPITSADERLLADLASHAGLVLRNVRLIEELRASRQRLVTAQDQERRRIERNLHDGAQQELVALAVKMRLARTLLDTDRTQADSLLEELQGDVGGALENLRDLARGIYPPMLADNGLGSALRSQAQKASLPVDVESDGIGRYAMEVESAIYFCVLEALQNVAKYAGASRAVVRLGENDGRLEFSVSDDGAGFDPATAKRGAGTTNMTDRVEALGGKLQIASQPGAGTTVSGSIPISKAASSA